MQSNAEILALLNASPSKKRMVLDTDTFNEIDDQFALVLSLLSPDKVNVGAVYAAPFFIEGRSASPGDGMELSYEEIVRILKLMDRSPEGFAFRGVKDYVGAAKKPLSAPAVEDLIARARASSPADPLYVVAIGAISNVASALLAAPDIIDRIVVVWLGGNAHHWPHNHEFNLMQDIGGAQVLFDSGAAIVQVPLMGVVSHLTTTVPEIDAYVRPHGPLGEFLADRFATYRDDQFARSKELWDLAAVAFLVNPDALEWGLVSTPIANFERTWSIDLRRNLMMYVHQIDRDLILGDLFRKLADFSGAQSNA